MENRNKGVVRATDEWKDDACLTNCPGFPSINVFSGI